MEIWRLGEKFSFFKFCAQNIDVKCFRASKTLQNVPKTSFLCIDYRFSCLCNLTLQKIIFWKSFIQHPGVQISFVKPPRGAPTVYPLGNYARPCSPLRFEKLLAVLSLSFISTSQQHVFSQLVLWTFEYAWWVLRWKYKWRARFPVSCISPPPRPYNLDFSDAKI